MKPFNSSPETFRYDEAGDNYEIDFVPDSEDGIFEARPNFWQYLLGKRMRVGKLITLKRILPNDAVQMMEGIMNSLDNYTPSTSADGMFRKFNTKAAMFDLDGDQINISKFQIQEINPGDNIIKLSLPSLRES